jgi:hypothetical protein
MTSLLDEIVAEQQDKRCKFGKILEEMSPEDRKGFEEALARPEITRVSIINVLSRRGLSVNRETMGKHVEEKCVCFV